MTRCVILALLAAALPGALADPPAGADWPAFRRDAARSGGDGSAAPAKAQVLWRWRNERDTARIMSSPAVAGGKVYFGCDNDSVFCLDADKGGPPVWTFPTKSWVFSSPAVADGRVYVGEGLHTTTDAKLYCLDAATGRKIWEFQTRGHVECTPTLAGGRVIFGAGDDGLYAVDAATGAKAWQVPGVHVDSSPLVADGLVVAGTGYGETLVGCWRADTGEQVWRIPVPASAWSPPTLCSRGVLVGIGNGNFEQTLPNAKAELLCLALADGAVLWRAPLKNAPLAAPAVAGGRIWLGNRGGEFGCWEAESGKRLWAAGCGRPVLSSAAIAENAVVYGCDGGHLHALDRDTGRELWKVSFSGDGIGGRCRVVSSPALAGGRFYVGCENTWFYCVGAKP